MGEVKCRPALGSTAQASAVPHRSYSVSRRASLPVRRDEGAGYRHGGVTDFCPDKPLVGGIIGPLIDFQHILHLFDVLIVQLR